MPIERMSMNEKCIQTDLTNTTKCKQLTMRSLILISLSPTSHLSDSINSKSSGRDSRCSYLICASCNLEMQVGESVNKSTFKKTIFTSLTDRYLQDILSAELPPNHLNNQMVSKLSEI